MFRAPDYPCSQSGRDPVEADRVEIGQSATRAETIARPLARPAGDLRQRYPIPPARASTRPSRLDEEPFAGGCASLPISGPARMNAADALF